MIVLCIVVEVIYDIAWQCHGNTSVASQHKYIGIHIIWHSARPKITVQCLHCHFLQASAQTAALLLCLPRCPTVTQGISMSFELQVLQVKQ